MQSSIWGRAVCPASPPRRMLCPRTRRKFPRVLIPGTPPERSFYAVYIIAMLDQLVADMLLYVSALELRPGTLTESEIEKLLTTAGKSRNPVRDRLLLLMAYRHALRVSELVDLRADQFDLEAAQVHIKRAKNGILSIHGLQSDEVRLIRQLIRENGEHSRFLFLSERGAPLSIDGATRSAGH